MLVHHKRLGNSDCKNIKDNVQNKVGYQKGKALPSGAAYSAKIVFFRILKGDKIIFNFSELDF
jgi:hypothetical protein